MPTPGPGTSGPMRSSDAMTKPPVALPTLQRNAIGLLLNKRDFTPAEVATLDYHRLERAPRIGRKGIENIRAWLRQYGLDLTLPVVERESPKELHRIKRVSQAIDILTRNGFVVLQESREKGSR